MSKKPSKHGPNKAKSIIAQPLFRSRQERAGKGKGSYRREAFQSNSWEASYFFFSLLQAPLWHDKVCT